MILDGQNRLPSVGSMLTRAALSTGRRLEILIFYVWN